MIRRGAHDADAPCSHVQLLHGFLHLHRGLFNVVFNAVEQRALVDDQSGKVFEQFGQGRDRLCNLAQFPIPSTKIQIRRQEVLR